MSLHRDFQIPSHSHGLHASWDALFRVPQEIVSVCLSTYHASTFSAAAAFTVICA